MQQKEIGVLTKGISFTQKSKFFFLTAFLILSFKTADAANLILSPAKGTHAVGETFSVNLYVSDNRDPINAISSIITFSTDTLELTSVRKTGSLITMWAEEPSFSNDTGRASFQGVVLNPGYSGVQGKAITLSFRAKKPGTGIVTILSGAVLANDGEATNVLGTLGSATFTLQNSVSGDANPPDSTSDSLAPQIKSSSYPDSTKWYNSREASFEWQIPETITAVRTLYDDSDQSVPTRVYDPPVNNRSFTVDRDGVQYMHVQFKAPDGWGDVSTFKFQVDTIAPYDLKVSFPDGNVTYNPKPGALITATDTTSGIGAIGLTIDGDKEVTYPYSPTNLYIFPKKSAGKHTAVVNVYDKAGNKASTQVTYTIDQINPPTITDYTRNVELGNPFVVTGTTYPQAIVEVTLTDINTTQTSQSITADDKGVFSLAWTKPMSTGAYEMKARAIDSKGAISDYTDNKLVRFDHIALIRFGIFIMNWLSLILIFIIAAVLVVATLWYSLMQFSRFRRRVRRTMKEAENSLKANVLALRRDTEEFHTLLVKTEKKRELTKEESAILKKFKKRLDQTELEIEKKLEQIG